MNKPFDPNSYFVFGTIDRKDWKRGQNEVLEPREALELVDHFKDIWDFEIRPAGWYRDDEE